MNFKLTEEQEIVKNMVSEIVQSEIMPVASKIDKEGIFPKNIIKQLAEIGMMGVYVPQEFGGGGMDYLSYILAVEEISKGCASTGVIVSVNNSLVCDPLLNYGNFEQKKKYLTPLAKGDALGCFALTEPNAGSDAFGQKTTAVKDGNHYILNGTKSFITNAKEADIAIVFAVTNKDVKKSLSISAFIVDMSLEGVTIGKIEDKLGIKGSSSCSIIFNNVKVHKSCLLGELGDGVKIAMATLDGGRIGIAAQSLGIATAALNDAIEYSKDRKQFNQFISQFQTIQFMLAEMATRIEAARYLTYNAAFKKQSNEIHYSVAASMAKLFASETAGFVSSKAIQIFGGYGYTSDYKVERYYRDAKITEIYEGTSEIQKMIISKYLLN